MLHRSVLALQVTAVLAAGIGASVARAHDGMPRLRGLDREARSLIAEASARSSTVRGLVARIEASDLIVLVHLRPTATKPPYRGWLQLLGRRGGVRYVEIWIDREVRGAFRIALLGHELQHASELALATEVVDAESFARFYRHAGYEHAPERFETGAAQAVERLVLRQVRGVS